MRSDDVLYMSALLMLPVQTSCSAFLCTCIPCATKNQSLSLFSSIRRIAPAGFVYAQILFAHFACFVGVIRAVRSTNLAGLSLLPICTVPKKFEWK